MGHKLVNFGLHKIKFVANNFWKLIFNDLKLKIYVLLKILLQVWKTTHELVEIFPNVCLNVTNVYHI